MIEPLISIIIPTHNRAHLIGETLNSVIHQSYNNWECIVIDDGSKDSTAKVVSSIKEERIKYFYQEHGERSKARNLGLSKANGEFIQFLDSDDLLQESKLEVSIALLNQETSANNLCITNFRTFSHSKESTNEPYYHLKREYFNYREVLFNWDIDFTIPIHCGLFKRDLLKDFKFPENLSQREDWFLWLQVFQQRNVKAVYIDEPLVLCRMREDKKDPFVNDVFVNEEKVLEYLLGFIPEQDRVEYYLKLIRRKNEQLTELRNSIKNYRRTRTFRISERLKKILGL